MEVTYQRVKKGSFMEFVKGEKEISIKEWMLGLLKYLFHELVANGKLLGTLIMLTIFSALLQSLQSAFSKSSVSKIADAVVYMVLIIFALNSFYVVMTYARETIQTMVDFILALLPILLALIATGGGVVSVSFFSSDYHLLNEYEWAFDELYRSTTFITCNDIKYCKYDE